jgi:hypothetical protein
MSKVTNNYQLQDIVTYSILKKKFKEYVSDAGHTGFKSNIYPKYLVVSLVMVLEEILSDCLEHVRKHETTGLYLIDLSMVQMVFNKYNKYDFSLKYFKKYNATFRYQDSVLFTYRKVVDNLESKYGDKLMIDPEAKNFIAHILSSLQYDLIEMSLTMVVYANRKTLSMDSLLFSYEILFKEMYPKIKLKLDSLKTSKNDDENENENENENETENETENEHENINAPKNEKDNNQNNNDNDNQELNEQKVDKQKVDKQKVNKQKVDNKKIDEVDKEDFDKQKINKEDVKEMKEDKTVMSNKHKTNEKIEVEKTTEKELEEDLEVKNKARKIVKK